MARRKRNPAGEEPPAVEIVEEEPVPAEEPEEAEPESADAGASEEESGEEESPDGAVENAAEDAPEDVLEAGEEEENPAPADLSSGGMDGEDGDGDEAPSGGAEEEEAPAEGEEEEAEGEGGDEEDEDGEEGDPALSLPLASVVEAVLFAAREPLKMAQIARAVGKRTRQDAVRQAIEELNVHYLETSRAFEIAEISGRYQLMSRPEYADHIMRIYPKRELTDKDAKSQRLTPAMLDTLAIVAYKQPVMRSEIDHIRGVASANALRSLIERGSVKEVGRRTDLVGKPAVFGTTERFLAEFGLGSLDELPMRNEFVDPGGPPPVEMAPVEMEAAGGEEAAGSEEAEADGSGDGEGRAFTIHGVGDDDGGDDEPVRDDDVEEEDEDLDAGDEEDAGEEPEEEDDEEDEEEEDEEPDEDEEEEEESDDEEEDDDEED